MPIPTEHVDRFDSKYRLHEAFVALVSLKKIDLESIPDEERAAYHVIVGMLRRRSEEVMNLNDFLVFTVM